MPRAARIALWCLGSLVLLLAAMIALVWVGANSEGGRQLIERWTPRISSGHVQLQRLRGSFPQAIDLGRLELRDESGVWLSAERISLRWSPLALLSRTVRIQSLSIERLDVERAPASSSSAKSGRQGSPPRMELGELSIPQLILGSALAGARTVLTVTAHGHWRNAQDALASLRARRPDGAGRYELELRSDRAQLSAALRLAEPEGGPLEQLAQLPELGALDVTAHLEGPRAATALTLEARAGALHAQAQGTIDLVRPAADLEFRLDSPALEPTPGLGWRRLELVGASHGTLEQPAAQARLVVAGLRLPGDTHLTRLAADLEGGGGALGMRSVIEGLVLPGKAAALLSDAPLRIEAHTRLDDPRRPVDASVRHRLFSLEAHAVTARSPSANFELALADLAPFAALAQQDVRGPLKLHGTATGSSARGQLELEGSGDLTGSALAARLLGAPAQLRLSAQTSEREVRIQQLALAGRALTFVARGSAQRSAPGASQPSTPFRSVAGRWELTLPRLSELAASLTGDLKASGTLSGAPDALSAEMAASSTVSVQGSPSGTLKASLKASGLPARPSGTLAADGSFDGAPLRLDASLERATADSWHLRVHRTEWKSVHAEADLEGDAGLTRGSGRAQLRIAQLADLDHLTGSTLKGAVEAELSLRPGSRGPQVRALLEAREAGTETFSASARLEGAGPLNRIPLKLSAESPDVAGAPAKLEAAGRLDARSRALQLSQLSALYREQTLRLLAPMQLEFASGLEIHRARLGLARAVLELDGRVSAPLDARLALHGVDAALIDAFAPDLLTQGSLDAEAELKGDPSAPQGHVGLRIKQLRGGSAAARDLPAMDVRATAQLADGEATLDATLRTAADSAVHLGGHAPLQPTQPLALDVTGKLDAALLNPLLAAQGERLAGAVTLDGHIAGAASSPAVTGSVRFERGDFRDYVRGVHVGSIQAQLVADQGTVRIASLKGRAGSGDLALSGSVGVLEPQVPIALEIKARNAQPITSALLTATLDSDLKVSGNLKEQLQVGGTVRVRRAVIGIPNALPPNVAVLDVRRAGQKPPEEQSQQLRIGLDVAVSAPRDLLVQGRGLDAELGGDLHVSGTTATPVVSGGFEMIRGSFTLVSTQLRFKSGEVSFNGAGLKGQIDPSLDFVAEATASDATVTLEISGLADAPQFALSSSPPMPQDEILARLLFGENAAQLTALQIAQIGAGLATLSGVGGGGGDGSSLNPLAKVQKALGLDRLSVGGAPSNGSSASGDSSPGASVSAGRYVSKRVFVSAMQSTNGVSRVEVDVDLSKRLKLQTRLGNGATSAQGTTPENDPGSSVGLAYQFEY